MYLIKLNAISSTNDFIKNLSAANNLADFTVVWAAVQTKGKGQMGSTWVTDEAKNLTFSIFLNGDYLTVDRLFSLNILVSNAVLKALFALNLTNIYVKWPNDILSYNKKIAGILIENSIHANGSISSVIGIGINCDQTNFNGFPQASSILNQYGITVNFELLLNNIVENIKKGTLNLKNNIEEEWQFYHSHLFKKDVISVFEDKNGKKFNGIIKEVNRHGQLVIQLENDDLQCFNLKDVKLMY
ncbi:BirA family transcriptional regulator, biotin operon repressor / biotin-[acetyl-CoA-carboxylase] ligase [Paenimyroides aquimaris]|uniref:BirA family transcriptional regulator, biotin operon repressor / biotin-[acetyl-CoA-carboxylase] ligase n=1 Tax=Paenimyroides marinum TaxID=1159016 RepID=A0A1H6KSL6_9FLAO|nr:biotin--[acetyl-CoA-carboxylase] ligase [Paenimyroides aquimaris]SEH75902.1 BirA family transcriptional regulator, biotin operon repressor / biotin-[acetyl-CoA-carboxylase] ligase [Paenimyroides aquimaris]